MDSSHLVNKAQTVHAQLAEIQALYAQFHEQSPQVVEKYRAFAEKTYFKAKEELEQEAERLDRLLQGIGDDIGGCECG